MFFSLLNVSFKTINYYYAYKIAVIVFKPSFSYNNVSKNPIDIYFRVYRCLILVVLFVEVYNQSV